MGSMPMFPGHALPLAPCNCRKLCGGESLEDHDTRGFESFPDDAELVNFDAPDRKFVAVANAHQAKPAILQAADSKWLDWSPALARHGVKVEFLCEADIARFHKKKFGV